MSRRVVPALLLLIASVAAAEAPPPRLCVDRLRLQRNRGYPESARLYRDRALLFSLDGAPPLRVTPAQGGWLQATEAATHRWVARYVDGTTYEAERVDLRGPPECLWYRGRYGHFELTPLADAQAHGRCLDCQ